MPIFVLRTYTNYILFVNYRDVPLERIAYLAQHSLFEHLPTLRHDIAVPAYAKAFLSGIPLALSTEQHLKTEKLKLNV